MPGVHLYKRGKIWWYSYTINGKRIQKSTHSTNRKTAQLVISGIAIQIDRIAAGLELPKNFNEISLTDFYNRIIKHIETRKTKETYRTYLLHAQNFYKYLNLTDCQNIDDINVQVIDDFITWRLQNRISANTINHELDSMRALFNIGIRLNWIEKNPFIGIERPARVKKQPYFYKKDEIERLFQHITKRFKPFFYVLLYTGARAGELLLFEWDEFNFQEKTINIKRKESRTEIKARPRAIPMHEKVAWSIKQRQKLNEHEKYVFTTKDGNLFKVARLRNFLNRAKKKAGLKNGSLHTFRHTFASHLVSKGVDLYRVKDYLGHKSIKQTEIYAHLQPSPDKRILDDNLEFDI